MRQRYRRHHPRHLHRGSTGMYLKMMLLATFFFPVVFHHLPVAYGSAGDDGWGHSISVDGGQRRRRDEPSVVPTATAATSVTPRYIGVLESISLIDATTGIADIDTMFNYVEFDIHAHVTFRLSYPADDEMSGQAPSAPSGSTGGPMMWGPPGTEESNVVRWRTYVDNVLVAEGNTTTVHHSESNAKEVETGDANDNNNTSDDNEVAKGEGDQDEDGNGSNRLLQEEQDGSEHENYSSNSHSLALSTSIDDPLVVDLGSITIFVGNASVTTSGRHAVTVEIEFVQQDDYLNNDRGATTTTTTTYPSSSSMSREYQSYPGVLSLLPLVVVLFLAITTQMVELSLLSSVFVGACMVAGNAVGGFKRTLDTYLVGAITDTDHAYVYLFGLAMAGFVGLLEKSGGVLGFTNLVGKYAKSSRTGQFYSFGTCLLLCFDDYANIFIAGPALQSVLDSVMVSREKLALFIDATAAPLASLTPISSWIGFEVGLIQTELDRIASLCDCEPTVGSSGLGVFLSTMKYRYYVLFMVFLILVLIGSQRDFGPMLTSERLTRVYKRRDGGPGRVVGTDERAAVSSEEGDEDRDGRGVVLSKNSPEPDTPALWFNFVVPVGFLVFFIVFFLIRTGKESIRSTTVATDDEQEIDPGFWEVIQSANSFSAILWGISTTSLCTLGMYLLQFKHNGQAVRPMLFNFVPLPVWSILCKGSELGDSTCPKQLLTWQEGVTSYLSGMTQVFGGLIVLTLAWAAGDIMSVVGLERYFSQVISDVQLDPRALPTVAFLVSLFVAFATGTSWGTMTMMFPLLLVPCYDLSGGDTALFYGTAGAILCGAVAGDQSSPISDTTILSSMTSDCRLLQHVKTQLPYTFLVAAWVVLVGTLPVGYQVYPGEVGIIIGLALLCASVMLLGRPVIDPTGAFDPVQEIVMRFDTMSGLHRMKDDTRAEYIRERDAEVQEDGRMFEWLYNSVRLD